MSSLSFANGNVAVSQPTKWEELKRLSSAHLDFTLVEIKGCYLIGLLDDICSSVQHLLRHKKAWPEYYLPAFSLFASSIDLFGRCLTANETLNVNENLRVGFWYLLSPTENLIPRRLDPSLTHGLEITTLYRTYAIEDLISLRNYSAHGQATADNLPGVDKLLMEQFPDYLGTAIETYWFALKNEEEYCNRLGRALIDPYSNRAEPLSKALRYFSQGLSVGDLFFRLDWSVK